MMNIFAYQRYSLDHFDDPSIDSFENAVELAPLGIGSYYFDRRVERNDILNITNERVAVLHAQKFDMDILMECSNLFDYTYRKIAADFDQAVSMIDPDSHTVFGIDVRSADLLVRHYFETRSNAEKIMTDIPQFVICEHVLQKESPMRGGMTIVNKDFQGNSITP